MLFGNKIERFTSNSNDEPEDDRQAKFDLRVIGLTLLIWGALLYLIDSTPVGNVFTYLPYFEKSEGSLDLSLSSEKGLLSRMPTILAVIIIFIGLVLALHGHSGHKAQATLIVTPIFYTLSFMFLIATIKNNNSKLITGGISLACFIIGVAVQAANKDNIDDINKPPPTTVPTTQTTVPTTSSQ